LGCTLKCLCIIARSTPFVNPFFTADTDCF